MTCDNGVLPETGTIWVDSEPMEIRTRVIRDLKNYLIGILDTGD